VTNEVDVTTRVYRISNPSRSEPRPSPRERVEAAIRGWGSVVVVVVAEATLATATTTAATALAATTTGLVGLATVVVVATEPATSTTAITAGLGLAGTGTRTRTRRAAGTIAARGTVERAGRTAAVFARGTRTATAGTTRTARRPLLLLRSVDADPPTVHLLAIEGDGSLRPLGASKRDEAEATRTTGLTIGDHPGIDQVTKLGEHFLQALGVHGPGQPADEQFCRHL
jgi:hypothetical protein